jgi:hypothetical protein
MKWNTFILTGLALLGLGAGARADTLALWTFETSPPADVNNVATGPIVTADSGTGTLKGVHASASSDWSTPAGAGSANSYSGTVWSVGDYFEFTTSSAGYEHVLLSFDASGSDTGPKNFKVTYSSDGVAFTDLPGGDYSLVNVTGSWGGASVPAASHYSFDLTSVASLDNDSSIFFRLVQVDPASIGGGTVGTGGTSRIDNVLVTADAIPASVPLPASALAGGSLLSLLALRRRSCLTS